MRWIPILLLAPLVCAAELDDFLSANPTIPTPVECDQTYQIYVYKDNGGIDYIIVGKGNEPIFNFGTYKQVLLAYLHKEHLSKFTGDIRILTPSSVPAFSQLRSKLRDEEYELSVARTYVERCFPKLTSQIDTMETIREKLVDNIQDFTSALSLEADRLVNYLKSKSASCGFAVDTKIYDDLESTVDLLNTYESYSKQIRASIAVTDTNCTPDFVQGATSALKPPFSSDQLQYFITSSAAEREIFSYQPDDEEVRALLQKSIRKYWEALYEERLSETIETPFGSFTLQEAIQYIVSANIPWDREDRVKLLRERYDETMRLAANGEYHNAYDAASDLRSLVDDIFEAGIEDEGSFEIPAWVYGVVILMAGVILLKLLGGRGGSEEELDDVCDYDYA